LGINIKAYETKADFNRNVNKLPAGISFNYLRSTAGPISFGGEVGVAMYSNDSYDIQIDGQNVEIQEEDCFFTFHAYARYTIAESNWNQVYLEGRMGATMFFSSSMAVEYDSEYDDKFDVHGTAFNTGLGGGIMIRPASIFDKENDYSNFWINLGANFMRGSETEYRMAPENPSISTFEDGHHRSLTHYVGYRLGFVFEL